MKKTSLSPTIMTALAAVVLAVAGAPAQAQSMEEKLRTQLRSTTQQLQQLQSQQAQVNAARAAAEAQRDAAQKELDSLRAQLDKSQRANASLSENQQAVQASAQAQVAAMQAQTGKVRQAYDELLAIARSRDAERVKAVNSLGERDAQLKLCQTKNDELYAAGKEILTAYESFSTGDLMALRQPFSQKARVAFDEQAQQMGDRLYDGKFDPRLAKPAVQ